MAFRTLYGGHCLVDSLEQWWQKVGSQLEAKPLLLYVYSCISALFQLIILLADKSIENEYRKILVLSKNLKKTLKKDKKKNPPECRSHAKGWNLYLFYHLQ